MGVFLCSPFSSVFDYPYCFYVGMTYRHSPDRLDYPNNLFSKTNSPQNLNLWVRWYFFWRDCWSQGVFFQIPWSQGVWRDCWGNTRTIPLFKDSVFSPKSAHGQKKSAHQNSQGKKKVPCSANGGIFGEVLGRGGGHPLAPVGARKFLGSQMRFAIAREHPWL